MRFLAGKTEAVTFAQLEVPFAHPQLETAREDVAGLFTVVAVALLAVGAWREA
ncbi:hypothetical protein D3C76_1874390 [compost metagenome]